jgi:membrane protein YqaA with SNARE-associated domain
VTSIIDIVVQWATNLIGAWGLPAVFFLMLLESACIPVPSEAIMPFAGFAVSEGTLTFVGIVAAGVAGNLVGSWIAYAVGYYGGRPFVDRWGKYVLLRPQLLQKLEMVLAAVNAAKPTVTGFTVMTFLRGFSELMEDLYLEREHVEALADIVLGFEEGVIRQLKAEGFDSVGLADDWGTQSSLFISPALWREVFKPRYKRQIELAHACGLDVYFHCCGYIYEIIPDLIEIGLDILNPGQPNINNVRRMGEAFSGKICFACPVSYQTTGISGTPEHIRAEVREFVDCLGNRDGGLIGIIPGDLPGLGAPQSNIDCMVEAFRS